MSECRCPVCGALLPEEAAEEFVEDRWKFCDHCVRIEMRVQADVAAEEDWEREFLRDEPSEEYLRQRDAEYHARRLAPQDLPVNLRREAPHA